MKAILAPCALALLLGFPAEALERRPDAADLSRQGFDAIGLLRLEQSEARRRAPQRGRHLLARQARSRGLVPLRHHPFDRRAESRTAQRIDDPLLDRLDADVVDQRTTQR